VASCGNCLPTFRENISVPSLRVKSPRIRKFVKETLYKALLNSATLLRGSHDSDSVRFPRNSSRLQRKVLLTSSAYL
jgi:hypothetical protein